MIRVLAIASAVLATGTLLAVPTSSFSAESKKPKEIVVVGSKAKKGGQFKSVGGLKTEQGATEKKAKGLKAKGRTKQGDGAIRTFNLMNSFPQK
jgi:hypothetical protein